VAYEASVQNAELGEMLVQELLSSTTGRFQHYPPLNIKTHSTVICILIGIPLGYTSPLSHSRLLDGLQGGYRVMYQYVEGMQRWGRDIILHRLGKWFGCFGLQLGLGIVLKQTGSQDV
jgi:hypothetical protein